MKLNSLENIQNITPTRAYEFKIEGLPDNTTEQEAINQMLLDLSKQGKIDIELISDGKVTFKQLHNHIENLTK